MESTSALNKQYVADLKDKDSVLSVFLASEKVVASDKNGKSFLSVTLNDATGSINARMFDRVDEIGNQFNNGDFVRIKGHVQVYQSRKQILIHDMGKVSGEQIHMKDFVARGKVNPDELYRELMAMVQGMRNIPLQQLCLDVLQDEEIKSKLLLAPAAKTVHHAYIGGLIEHIVSICRLLQQVARLYPDLDPDLLIFGGIFHDIGKLWELEVGPSVSYTDSGRLVGHMVLACDLVEKKSAKIMGFTDELRDILKHIILSHHGRLEYGSPKLPMLPEAVIVAMIDELDSRLNTIMSFMKSELSSGEKWTRFHPQLERYFYLDFLRERTKSR